MPKQLPFHHDRGDGTCDGCFEEWPCIASKTAGWRRGVDTDDDGGVSLEAWESEGREVERAETTAAIQATWARLVDLAERAGLPSVVAGAKAQQEQATSRYGRMYQRDVSVNPVDLLADLATLLGLEDERSTQDVPSDTGEEDGEESPSPTHHTSAAQPGQEADLPF